MIIKKFQAKTKEEALENAYTELGPNLVEMNVRNVKKKGLFGFLSPQMVEVTVALEEETPQRPVSSEIVEAIAGVRQVAEASLTKEEKESYNKPATQEVEVLYTPSPAAAIAASVSAQKAAATAQQAAFVQKNTTAQQTAFAQKNTTAQQAQRTSGIERIANLSESKPSNEEENYEKRIVRSDSSVIEEKLDSLHNMLEAQLQKPEEQSTKTADEAMAESAGVSREVGKFIKVLYNTMIDNEINEKYANQIIEEMEKNISPNTPFEMALSNIYQKMILKFGNPETIKPAVKGPKVVFFVGPTGVGKTTTIAKIASKYSVEYRKKVALLTADTYRIAAAEQLHTYANILEIPFRIIYAIEEVEKALVDFKDYDFILVDTAGHSHHNEAQREVMNGFIHSVDGICEKDVFLVLSATTKYRDLISIADTYSAMTQYKLIFTKLDETTTLGNLLNIKLHTKAALSYVTCGQNVPEDIEEFNPQKTVKQLLGGRKG